MKSRIWLGALLTLLAAALLLPAAAAAANTPADTVFKNGYVYTVNPGVRVAHAVAVKDGRIVYVGSDKGVAAFVGPEPIPMVPASSGSAASKSISGHAWPA